MPELDLGSGDTSGNNTNFLCLRVYGWRKLSINQKMNISSGGERYRKKMSKGKKKNEGSLISYIRQSRKGYWKRDLEEMSGPYKGMREEKVEHVKRP